jgi:type III secretion protein J
VKYLFRIMGLCLVVVFLSACGEVALHHNLDEIEADKILVLLDKNDIRATKKKEIEGQTMSWTVLVPQKDSSMARRLLVENNLPHRPELGLSGVYSEKGLIPTPDEQRARFLLALKGEVVNALRKIPGVHEVGVVLNVPEEEEIRLGESENIRPSASVVLRVGDPRMLHRELTEEKIKRFVANAIPDMDPNDVIVIISADEGVSRPAGVIPPSEPFPSPPREPGPPGGPGGDIAVSPGVSSAESGELIDIAGIKLNRESVGKFRFYLVIFLCVLILLSAALLLTLFRFSRMRRYAKPRRLEAVELEGQQGGPDLLESGRQAMGGEEKR